MINRRAFIGAIAALGAATRAQGQGTAAPRIGWISYSAPGPALGAFREGMQAAGYAGGSAPVMEVRQVEPNPDSVRAAVEELLRLPVALIICQAAIAPVAHRMNAGRVPLVFAFSGDPVVAGMVESFGRPGGTSTGMSFLALELVGKRLEVMREFAPSVHRVAIVANPQHPGEKAELRASLDVAERLGMHTIYVQILPGESPEAAFALMRKERAEGIIVFQDAGMVTRASRFAEFALKERIPAVSGWAQFAEAGFLVTYGPNLNDVYRRLAGYVDKILKGARPATLPVELPTRIELVVNARTAKALGLAVPQSVLIRADEVIS